MDALIAVHSQENYLHRSDSVSDSISDSTQNVPLHDVSNAEAQSVSSDVSPNPRKRTYDTMEGPEEDVDKCREEGLLCPVCLDAWTSSGPHRLCSLKCGHLFGLSCVNKWLSLKNRTCPTCNSNAKKKDIREIYASKLVVLDTSEMESLRSENTQLKTELHSIKRQLFLQTAIVQYYKEQHEDAETNKTVKIPQINSSCVTPMRYVLRTRMALNEGECRLLSYNEKKRSVVVSQQNRNVLWQGFGIRTFSNDFQSSNPLVPTHKEEIRDLAFSHLNDDLILIVSFDKEAKIFDFSCSKTIFKWTSDQRLWSCCWDAEQSSAVYIGDEKGCVFRLDISSENLPQKLPLPLDKIKPVAVLSLISSQKLGCILCCRLLSLTAYTLQNAIDQTTGQSTFEMQLLLEGRFAAMALSDDGFLVVTSRPTHEHTQVRHLCYQLDVVDGHIEVKFLQVFLGGNQLTQLSRTSLLRTPIGHLFFALDESVSMIFGWRVGQQTKIASIPSQGLWRDILAIYRDNEILLFALSKNLLKYFKLYSDS